MLISGTISQVTPPDFTDPHNNQYQNITIQTSNGPYEGRIASKHPYTNEDLKSSGQWDSEVEGPDGRKYNRLRKHRDQPYPGQQDPQYAQQGNQQPAGNSQGENRAVGMVRHGVVCAGIQSIQIECKTIEDCNYWTNFIMTGQAPLPPNTGGPIEPGEAGW